MNNSSGQKLILIVNAVADTDAEIDLHASEWRLPDSIDDSDITFAGKPLSTLFEEDRRASLHSSQESGDYNSPDKLHCECREYCECAPIQHYRGSQAPTIVSIICRSRLSDDLI